MTNKIIPIDKKVFSEMEYLFNQIEPFIDVNNFVDVKSIIYKCLKTSLKETKKQAVTEFMKELPKEKEEIEPTEYHYICYGGSVCSRIDSWGKEKIKQCPYKGEVNWMVKTCEKCDGNIEGQLKNDEYEIAKNREIREYNNCLKEIRQNANKFIN